MESAGINTDIHKPNSTMNASNTMFFKPGVPLEEVLKRGQSSHVSTFFLVRSDKLKFG